MRHDWKPAYGSADEICERCGLERCKVSASNPRRRGAKALYWAVWVARGAGRYIKSPDDGPRNPYGRQRDIRFDLVEGAKVGDCSPENDNARFWVLPRA